ncbi:MAG: DUF4956 domain-containing protein [Anaerolineaceae bacterium]|nr:DUF4956 domain-containing protein [Anaerolineaceae bacterium]
MSEIISLVLGFGFNFLVAFIIVRFIYFPIKRNKKYIFTFLAFNTMIYFVLLLLSSVDLSVGFGFGLFAIFSVLRYRTNPIPIREMTYLFIIIALPVMNSILMNENQLLNILLVNTIILVVLKVIENEWGFHYVESKNIQYERIELIKPEKHDLLIADLKERTGLNINRFEIGEINFLTDTAEIRVFYEETIPGKP